MNCHRVTALLPLYVESDLDTAVMQEVAAHLSRCAECAIQAQELTASQAWLRGQTLPDFDERFFAELKRDVMREVEKPRLRLWQMLFGQLQRKPLWVAVSAIIVMSALAFYAYQQRGQQGLALSAERTIEQNAPAIQAYTIPANNSAPPVVQKVSNKGSVNASRHHFGMRRQRAKQPLPKLPEIATEPTYIAGGNQEPAIVKQTDTTAPPEMTRIEFQTDNPKIRIIWFVPKVTETPKVDTE